MRKLITAVEVFVTLTVLAYFALGAVAAVLPTLLA